MKIKGPIEIKNPETYESKPDKFYRVEADVIKRNLGTKLMFKVHKIKVLEYSIIRRTPKGARLQDSYRAVMAFPNALKPFASENISEALSHFLRRSARHISLLECSLLDAKRCRDYAKKFQEKTS